MNVKQGDLVRVCPSPDVAQELWDHAGLVVDEMRDHRLVVRMDTGDELPVFPENLVRLPGRIGPPSTPFDVFPGPWRTRPPY